MRTKIFDLISEELKSSDNQKGKVVGKFILVKSDDEISMLFGGINEYPYHANLLEQFCSQQNIPSFWSKKPDELTMQSDIFKLCGGGWVEVNFGEKKFTFFGESKAYGKFILSELNYFLTENGHFKEFETVIKQ